MQCMYRKTKECDDELNDNKECHLCLFAQEIDELSLINSAIGNLTASIEEALIK